MWPVAEAGESPQSRQHGSTLTRSLQIEYIRDRDDQSHLNVRSHPYSLGLSGEFGYAKYENTDPPHHEIESAYIYGPIYQLLDSIFLKSDCIYSPCHIKGLYFLNLCPGSYPNPLDEFEGDCIL